ncbi:hypothetical protein IH992_11100 [Candidatus Poribacteria bacterium]|nr:hypothetical protein [Candidatus Poribacteria bacterium]
MKTRNTLTLLAILMMGLLATNAWADEKKDDPEKSVICLHDGMVMKAKAMKDTTTHKDHRHYICGYGTDELARFEKHPERYFKTVSLTENLDLFIHFQTLAEYKDVMKGMNMTGMMKGMMEGIEMTKGATHFIIANLIDKKTGEVKNGKDVKVQLELTDPKGEKQTHALSHSMMMKSHIALYALPDEGKYPIVVSVEIEGKKNEAKFGYTLVKEKKAAKKTDSKTK